MSHGDKRARDEEAPGITGRLVITLTVTNLSRSADWYGQLLGAREHRDVDPDGKLRQVALIEPRSGLELCLVSYPSQSRTTFSEFRAGMDHLEFIVATRNQLDDWVTRLDHLGIEHSGIKAPDYTNNRMITFRDPDNIQLEFFWSAASSESSGV